MRKFLALLSIVVFIMCHIISCDAVIGAYSQKAGREYAAKQGVKSGDPKYAEVFNEGKAEYWRKRGEKETAAIVQREADMARSKREFQEKMVEWRRESRARERNYQYR